MNELDNKYNANNQQYETRTFYWHYAWVIVIIASVIQMVGASIRMAFGVFIDPLSQTFGWDQGVITLAYAINMIVSALASPIAGWIGDRYGTRKAMTLGGTMFIAGMLITGIISQPWEFCVAFGILLGIAQSIFLVPLVPGVMRWYKRQLGWAMGISMAAWGIGPAVVAPIMLYLIIYLGWQGAFWTTAAGSALIIAIMIFLYRDSPSEKGLLPYGSHPNELTSEELIVDNDKSKIFSQHIRKTAGFYNMSSIHFLGCVGHSIIIVYLVPLAVHEGIAAISASLILAAMTAISVPFRLLVPVVAEKQGLRSVMAIFFFLQGITVIMLFWTHDQWMFYLFAILFGIAYGGEAAVFPILNRRYYGNAPQGLPYGFQMFGAGLGMALGGWIPGKLFDITGTYDLAITISIVTSLAGMFFIFFLESTDKLLIPDWDTNQIRPNSNRS